MEPDNRNKIGVATATIVGMNAMIGAGIFAIPAALAFYIGPAGILTTIFVAFAVWFIAQSIAQLASLYPEEGSFYTYAKQWSGHFGGLLAISAYLIGLLIAMGLLTQFAGIFLQWYFPNVPAYTLGFIALALLVILNMLGVILSEIGQQILIVSTIFPLIATVIMCLTKANLNNLVPFAPYGFRNVLQGSKDIIFSFFGFECAASLFAVVKEPKKNVPKALTFSLVLVACIYVLFSSSIILSIPLNLFVNPKIPFTVTLSQVFPEYHWLIAGIHLSMLSATLGTIHSMIWSSSALFISIVRQLKNNFTKNLLSSNFINSKSSVLLMGLSIFTSFTLLEDIAIFFNLTALFIVFAYTSSMVTLLTLKDQWESGQNTKTVIGIGAASVIFIIAAYDLVIKLLN